MLKHTYLKLVEMQEEQAKRHLEEVRVIHSEMRGYKHDFHHHLQALKGQLEAGEVERALAYIEQLDRSLQSVDTLLKTGNVTVDAILSGGSGCGGSRPPDGGRCPGSPCTVPPDAGRPPAGSA
jgi:two-component system sensor histidine kinase AgrC